ncbi:MULTISPECIES: hypothetical protein [unclassified Streptomyces]|uniref:hypothetical protein n=1 Tax=unclassified Streptomyces TaxID=2593676 RepID=UPI00368321D8
MQRPNAAQLTCGSATVVLATVGLLLLSGTTTTPGIAAACAVGLLLGVLVAVTMPVRTGSVKTPVPTPSASGDEAVRVPAARVGGRAGTRTGS